MQIDLLISSKNEVGILSDTEFETDPSGVIFDGLEHSLTLEFSQTYDSMEMNVPLSDEVVDIITSVSFIHVGVMSRGRILKAAQLPLMHVNVREEEYY